MYKTCIALSDSKIEPLIKRGRIVKIRFDYFDKPTSFIYYYCGTMEICTHKTPDFDFKIL